MLALAPVPIRRAPPVPLRREPLPPVDGWTCLQVIDLNEVDPFGVDDVGCERCNTSLRWLHLLAHDDWPERLVVGCCCAKRLCDGYDAKGAERLAQRRDRFLCPSKWRVSMRGNLWRRYVGWTVTIFAQGGTGFNYCVSDGGDGKAFAPSPFDSAAAAQLGAWEHIATH